MRTRMTAEDRRLQLLRLGAQLFAEQPYEDVHVERVAEMAGVSRGLLYHYFPTKRAFFAELLVHASAALSEATAPDPALPVREQLANSVDAYLLHCRAHEHGARAVYRGSASGDPTVQALIEDSTRAAQDRVLDAVQPSGERHALLLLAVRSWLMFLRTACHSWLDTPQVPREQVRDLCTSTLIGALQALPDEARPDLPL